MCHNLILHSLKCQNWILSYSVSNNYNYLLVESSVVFVIVEVVVVEVVVVVNVVVVEVVVVISVVVVVTEAVVIFLSVVVSIRVTIMWKKRNLN